MTEAIQDQNLDIDWLSIEQEVNDIFKPPTGEITINTPELAEWFAGKIRIYHQQLDDIHRIELSKLAKLDAIYKEQREKIISATNLQKRPIEKEIQSFWMRFGSQFQVFLSTTLSSRKSKSKSMNIGGLTFGHKKEQDRVKITNEEELMDWLLENDKDDLIKPSYSVPHDAAKALVEAEEKAAADEKRAVSLPPGILKTEGKERFYVAHGRKEINMLIGVQPAESAANPEPSSTFTTSDLLENPDEEIAY